MLRLSRLAPGLRALRTTFQSALPRAAAISFGASIARQAPRRVRVLCVCVVRVMPQFRKAFAKFAGKGEKLRNETLNDLKRKMRPTLTRPRVIQPLSKWHRVHRKPHPVAR